MAVLNEFLAKVLVQIVNPIILLLSAVSFLYFVWGVFLFVYRANDGTARSKGRTAIAYGLVGLVIIFGAYGIINIAVGTFPGFKQLQKFPTPK